MALIFKTIPLETLKAELKEILEECFWDDYREALNPDEDDICESIFDVNMAVTRLEKYLTYK